MSIKSLTEEYFRSLNTISGRIYSDLEETKASYEDLWVTLSEKEQQQILSESIIKPEISIKYSSKEEDIKSEYAMKLIFDDHCSYRDEHSGPFSFRTKSQRDLRIFPTDKQEIIKKSKSNAQKLKPNPTPLISQMPEFKQGEEILKKDSSNNLPKTGLDFLDNW